MMNRFQKLDEERRDGTKGAYRLECSLCGHLWLCLTRWSKRFQRWLVVHHDEAFCPVCWQELAMPVLGTRLPGIGTFEGWRDTKTDAAYVLGVAL